MPDLIQTRSDGSAVLNLATGKVTLRRPTVGLVRAVQDATIVAADEAADRADDLREQVEQIAAEHGVSLEDESQNTDPKALRAFRRATREPNQAFVRAQQAAFFDVGRLVVKSLSSATLPDEDDDLDPVLGSASLYTRLISHWLAAPFGSSERDGPT